MDCVTEESEIRRALDRLDGIRALTFRLSERNVHIDASPAVVEEAAGLLRRIGFDARPVDERPATPEAATDEQSHEPAAASVRTAAMKLACALVLAISAELVGYFVTETMVTKALGLALAGSAIALAGFDVYKKGIAALLAGRLNINALMSVAVTGAVFIGQWAEAAMVMALYAIAELIEARAVERARHAITGLMAMAPETATVRQDKSEWRVERVGDVPLRAIVRIGPGERVPLDGIVVAGNSSINQAPVTGESIPVDKEAGDPVFAGTINENGLIEVEVTALAANSALARIIHAVEQAEGNRAPTQRFVDRFAAVYTPAVFVIAILVAVSGPWLFGWTWLQAIYKALVLLVIACPCALVISTPVTVVSGLAAAARRGILIKGGVHLEGARHLKAIAFDKTGAITEGKPRLVEWSTLHGAADRDRIAAIVASLAGHSDHPVSKAIAEGLPKNGASAVDFKAIPGRGVSGAVDGQTYVLGNHRLIEEREQCSPSLEARLRLHETAGRSVTVLASNDVVLGIFAVADGIKAHSAEAVA
ncbi:MAG: heavy metal translocating P-type ATPase, partial [Deltaproteobacteria bacterium]